MNLTKILDDYDITQTYLSDITGISKQAISLYVKGTQPGGLALCKMALAIGCSPYLFYRDNEELLEIARKTNHVW